MIAVFINCAAVVLGSLLGLFMHRRITEGVKDIVFTAIGVLTLLIGISMGLESTRVLYLALSLVVGGLLGHLLGVENRILALGDTLGRRFAAGGARKETGEEPGGRGPAAGGENDSQGPAAGGVREAPNGRSGGLAAGGGRDFAYGFLNASVLFCVGAMSIVGSFKAGTEGEYSIILVKSVMDGFMAVLLTAAQGAGVAFSALSILAYQGGLTLLSGVLRPWVTPLVLSELTGAGGLMIMMIGLNLLALKTIRTANFLPALLVVILFVALEAVFPILGTL